MPLQIDYGNAFAGSVLQVQAETPFIVTNLRYFLLNAGCIATQQRGHQPGPNRARTSYVDRIRLRGRDIKRRDCARTALPLAHKIIGGSVIRPSTSDSIT